MDFIWITYEMRKKYRVRCKEFWRWHRCAWVKFFSGLSFSPPCFVTPGTVLGHLHNLKKKTDICVNTGIWTILEIHIGKILNKKTFNKQNRQYRANTVSLEAKSVVLIFSCKNTTCRVSYIYHQHMSLQTNEII